jgi:hypothetical protein
VKISESCFVWAPPPPQTGAIIKNRIETYLRQLSVCRESNPARVKASKREYYLVYIPKIFILYKNDCSLCPWGSGNTIPVGYNRLENDSWCHQICMFLSLFLFYYDLLTGFWLWRQYWRQLLGSLFKGAFLPQKWDVLPPF